jgi:hypothetical protein
MFGEDYDYWREAIAITALLLLYLLLCYLGDSNALPWYPSH